MDDSSRNVQNANAHFILRTKAGYSQFSGATIGAMEETSIGKEGQHTYFASLEYTLVLVSVAVPSM